MAAGLVVVLVSLTGRLAPLLILVLFPVLVWWIVAKVRADRRHGDEVRVHDQRRQVAFDRFHADHSAWRDARQRWDGEERVRVERSEVWFPLEPTVQAQRVDVFGGTPDGWAAMLCTVGSTLLEAGQAVLVVDFTEEDITGLLGDLAAAREMPVVRHRIPVELDRARLLDGLSGQQVAELVAESVETLRSSGHGGGSGRSAELRMLDIELVETVVSCLDGDHTFRRVEAGLLALAQGYDSEIDDRLSAGEFVALSDRVDLVVTTDEVRNELQFLRSVLRMLTGPDPAPSPSAAERSDAEVAGDAWPERGLAVLRTEDDNRRRRDLIDRLLGQVLLQQVRRRGGGGEGAVLVLCGADHLGLEVLELLARRCRQAGVRLVLFIEHLRDGMERLLGGADSSTFIMRLGNMAEATAAADHLGRGHRFLVTQLSTQATVTDGGGGSTSVGTSDTTGASKGFSGPPIGLAKMLSSGSSTSRSTTHTSGTSTSWSRAVSEGETVTRVYELAIEPTELQALDTTGFVFVEAVGGRRRIVAGNCDPAVAGLDRVSPWPRPSGRDAVDPGGAG